MKTVAIVGGGLAGLATAYYLQQRGDVRPIVLERETRWGGKLRTEHVDGFTLEGGPDSFLTQKPAALELCQQLGLGDDLICTNQAQRKHYILRAGRLVEMPAGMNLIVPTQLGPILRSPLLSPWGKLRLALEPLIPARVSDADESMAQFVRRRLGSEVLERLAAPLLAGIYAGDPERLSIQATFRRFPEDETAHGSLLRAALKQKAAPAPQRWGEPGGPGTIKWTPFVSLRGGIEQLVDTLVAHLKPDVLRGGASVSQLRLAEDQAYDLTLDSGERLRVDAVVLAVPAFVAAELLSGMAPDLAALLSQQRAISSATVSLGYRGTDVPHPLDGFGFVVPPGERRKITACTWASTKFAGRAPDDHVLLRCFIGRDGAEALLDTDDAGLVQMATDELRAILGITVVPVVTHVVRWPRGMPQYDVGHLEWVGCVEELVSCHTGLYLTGHSYRGIGLPDIIRDAQTTAHTIAHSPLVTRSVTLDTAHA